MPADCKNNTTVQAGGKIEVNMPDLPTCRPVITTISPADHPARPKRTSIIDIPAASPGGLMFKSTEDVSVCQCQERQAWGS